jgi:predicted nucleic acid-binding Zn ribbon protein
VSRRTGSTHSMRGLLGETLAKRGLKLGVNRARSVLMWPKVVGPELARITRARNQHGATLFVEARDSAQAHHLTMQRHHVLARLQIAMGDESVTELRFVVGTLPPEAVVVLQDALPPPDRVRARELAQDVPDHLKGAAVRAAEAITRARKWREQQGYSPCPVCGEATPDQPCRACTLTLQDPAVRRASPLLARDPRLLVTLPETLGDSGTRAARHLALEVLRDQMELLALECVRSGGEVFYREYLGEQARLFLAISLRRTQAPLTRANMKLLPERVQQVLAGSVEQEG